MPVQASRSDTFRSVYNRAMPRVYSYLHHRVGADETRALELTRATFVALADEWPLAEAVAPVEHILALARRQFVVSELKQGHRRLRAGKGAVRTDGDVDTLGEDTMQHSLCSLDPAERVVVVLRHVDGRSAAAVAGDLAKPEAWVTARHAAGIAKLAAAQGAREDRVIRRLAELDRPVIVPEGASSQVYRDASDLVATREGRVRADLFDEIAGFSPVEAAEIPRWRPVVALLWLGVMAAAVLTTVFVLRTEESPSEETSASVAAPTTTAAPAALLEATPPPPRQTADLPVGPPGWVALDPGPLGRSVAPSASVATDRDLFVWGPDGIASYSPTTAAWQTVDSPPVTWGEQARLVWIGDGLVAVAPGALPATLDSQGVWVSSWQDAAPLDSLVDAVWTGTELITVGTRLGTPAAVAYSPAAETWRELSPPPSAPERADLSWTGSHVMLLGASAGGEGLAVGLVYSPDSDEWREMPPASIRGEGVVSGWVAGRLVAVDAARAAASFTVESGWIQLDPVPLATDGCMPSTDVAGIALVAWFCGEAAVFDSTQLRWTRIATPVDQDGVAAVGDRPTALGNVVYFWGTGPDGSSFWSLLPGEAIPGGSETGVDGWSVLPPSQIDARAAQVHSLGGGDLLAWSPGADVPVTRYSTERDEWDALPAPPGAAAGRHAVWTGSELIVWGGTRALGAAALDGAVLDPQAGLWRPTTQAPPAVGYAAHAVWAGAEMIVWGAGAAAFDPAAGEWRSLPEPPLSGDAALVWSGSELLGFGRDVAGTSTVAAYDPSVESWRSAELPDDVTEPVVVWTGHEALVLWAGALEQDAMLLAAYVPATGEWRRMAAAPFSAVPQAAVTWTGSRLAAWDGDSRDPVVWLYNPLSDEWSTTAVAPYGAEAGAIAWAEDRIVVTGADRVMSFELGTNGATLPRLPGFEVPLEIGESIPLTLFAFDPTSDEGGIAAVVDLHRGVRVEYTPGEHHVIPPDRASLLPSGSFVTARGGVLAAYDAALYRAPRVVWETEGKPDLVVFGTADEEGEEAVWLFEGARSSGARRTANLRLVRVSDGEVELNADMAQNTTPVQATPQGLLVNFVDYLDTANGRVPDPETAEMGLVEPGGRVLPLGDGIGLAMAGETIVRLLCPGLVELDCTLRLTVPGGSNDAVAEPGGAHWVPHTQPGASLASPDGRWAIAAAVRVNDIDRIPVPVLVEVGRASAEILPFGTLHDAVSVAWSADSRWLVTLGAEPMAFNVTQGRWVSLAGVVPEGLVVYAAG